MRMQHSINNPADTRERPFVDSTTNTQDTMSERSDTEIDSAK